MILLTYATPYSIDITTEDVRIDTSVPRTQIRHLLKFTNDMDKGVKYVYGRSETINNRYTNITLTHNTTEDIVEGKINFLPYGYWKYEVYEVSFNGASVVVSNTTVPLSETGTASDQSGVYGKVKGLVEVGKLLVEPQDGTEQVQYTQRQEPSSTNYIFIE
jgi:hypothetical protein